MPRRAPQRFASWIAFVAILLSMLPPAGARHHDVATGMGEGDYCSVSGMKNPGPALPSPADRSHDACSHCDSCAGHAGVALIAGAAPTSAHRVAFPAIVEFRVQIPSPSDLIAPPPRGPPHSA